MVKRIDSGATYSIAAVEPKFGEAPAANTRWQELDLASYSSAGASTEAQARSVMAKGRRPRKGNITSRTVNFGYNTETTLTNVATQVAAFMWRKPEGETATRSIVDGLAGVPQGEYLLTVAPDSITAVWKLGTKPAAGHLLVVQDGVNDRKLQTVVSYADASNKTTVTPRGNKGALSADSKGESRYGKAVIVGVIAKSISFTVNAANIVVTVPKNAEGAQLRMPQVGEWLHFGDDTKPISAEVTSFFGRVSRAYLAASTQDTVLELDSVSHTITTQAALVDVPVFWGIFMPDGEDEISMQHKRFLGKDADGKTQEETFKGCLASEMAINISERSNVTLDFTYIGSDLKYDRLTTAPDVLYPTDEADPDASTFNTSTDIVLQRLNIRDASKLTPTTVHGLVKDCSITLNNNLTEVTGIGILGNDGASAGDVGATGSIDAYFIDLRALEAIRCNCTASLDVIAARKNQGFVVDIPALTLGGDGVSIENKEAVRLNVTQTGFLSHLGFVMSYTHFDYLPDSAMPEGDDCDC